MEKHIKRIQITKKGKIKLTHFNGYIQRIPACELNGFGCSQDLTPMEPELFDNPDVPLSLRFTFLCMVAAATAARYYKEKHNAIRKTSPKSVNWLMWTANSVADAIPMLPDLKAVATMQHRKWEEENKNVPIYLWVTVGGCRYVSKTRYNAEYHDQAFEDAIKYSQEAYTKKMSTALFGDKYPLPISTNIFNK